MTARSVIGSYATLYEDMNFERKGLFRLLDSTYHCREVLYPGCSVHITPSLCFSHVVYVDQSEAAAKFFADEKSVLSFVTHNKQYKQSAYIRFIHQDYSQPLPLREKSYDLLLALFASGIARSCTTYLKLGGLLLRNNHQGDAVDAAQHEELKLAAVIRFQKQSYVISEEIRNDYKIAVQKPNSKYLKQDSMGAVYMENEIYYLFRRIR